MAAQNRWTREQLLVAFSLYCRMPFGKMHSRNPEIIRYAALIGRTPSALAMKLTNIASLDPAIRESGRSGLSGASAGDREMWEEMNTDWENFSVNSYQAITQLDGSSEVAKELVREVDDTTEIEGEPISYKGNNRVVTTTARIGQNMFRRSVLSAYDFRCCISGLAHPKFLIASHIVPWRSDPTNRLNPRNGLCLSVLHDRAFDQGLITITESMTVQVSQILKESPDEFMKESILSFEGKEISTPEKFRPLSEFLDHHQKHIFVQ